MRFILSVLMAALLLSPGTLAQASAGRAASGPAQTPPMGWNSWDAYGFTITEDQFRANVAELVKLKDLGWKYAVIDEGWYMADPLGKNLQERNYQLDGNGLLIPALARFPSAAGGAGLKPLADLVHSHGLKFGVHIIRGIPKQAVEANLPIAGSHFRAADAANKADLCSWDDGNYGIRDTAAGQAYYDSMVKLFADWGIDFIKIDCVADHPYVGSEIRQISQAIKHSGREMVLSLSPGPTSLTHAAEVGKLAQMWRIADDTWDGWSFAPKDWPNGVLTGFDKLAQWRGHAKPGNWPDADMLPFGSLRPHPGWGEPRASRLSVDEMRTMFTLWAIARSPLILGGNLTELDAATRAVITNKDVIAVNQTVWDSHPVDVAQTSARVWVAQGGAHKKPTRYVAVFNTADTPLDFAARWQDLSLPVPTALQDLWGAETNPARADGLKIHLAPHASVMYRLQ
ncbi:MAG: glycoside hydrolase family 27 protein [Rhizomicrobium sp.]